MRTLLAITIGLLAFAPAAQAEAPLAGPFALEGMDGMHLIGLHLPFESAASIHILGCRVTLVQARCRLAVRSSGIKCRVRMNLTHEYGASYPVRSWHCPVEWRPVPVESLPDLGEAQQQKALRPAKL